VETSQDIFCKKKQRDRYRQNYDSFQGTFSGVKGMTVAMEKYLGLYRFANPAQRN
jgi:hypothetical protein